MEYEIDLLFGQENEIGHVVSDEAIIFVARQMSDVGNIPSDQIVDRDNTMPLRQQAISQMGSQKAGTTGHNRNGLGRSGHGGVFF